MIKIPQVEEREKTFLLEIVFVFILVIVLIASLVLFAYWYLFGERNPFKPALENEVIENVYVNPDYELQNLLIKKLKNAR